MEKNDNSQLELFSQNSEGTECAKPGNSGNLFFMRIRGYEKAMLLIMVLALTGIISYSWGVEKGRHAPVVAVNSSHPVFYTIQLAAFKNKEIALRESVTLKKKGLNPQVFLKGEYIVLCVGKFSDQESAQPILAELQKTYAACRIRRI